MATKKVKAIAAAIAVIFAAGYPVLAWFLGKQIETAHAEIDTQIAAVPYLKLVKHEYDRSLFSSDETITIELPAGMFNLPAQAASQEGGAPVPPLRVTMKTHIQHGPLPGLASFAAGRADTTVEFEGPKQEAISAAFGGKSMLSAQTLYNFQGGGHAVATIPAFKTSWTEPAGHNQPVTLSGDATEIIVDFTKSMQHYTFRGDMPRIEIAAPNNAGIKMTGLHMEGNQQRIFPNDPSMYSGTQQFSLAELSINPGTGESDEMRKVNLKALKYDLQVPLSGDFLDVIVKTSASTVQIGERYYGPANYDVSLKHLHARKVSEINRKFMEIYAQPAMPQTPQQWARAFAPMKEQFIGFLLDNPQFSIDRISFKTPEGEAKLSASIRLDDAKTEDFANPLQLQPKIDFAADVVLPAKLLLALVNNAAKSEEEVQVRMQKTMLAVNYLVQQGYASLDNDLFKSKITLKAGQLLANDKPFNPMAMAMQMQELEEALEGK